MYVASVFCLMSLDVPTVVFCLETCDAGGSVVTGISLFVLELECSTVSSRPLSILAVISFCGACDPGSSVSLRCPSLVVAEARVSCITLPVFKFSELLFIAAGPIFLVCNA